MLAQSAALRRGAKVILAISFLVALVAAGAILGDVIDAIVSSVVSASVFGF